MKGWETTGDSIGSKFTIPGYEIGGTEPVQYLIFRVEDDKIIDAVKSNERIWVKNK